MNDDDFLTDPDLAALHAQLREELAPTEPLPPHLRAAWSAAANEPTPAAPPARRCPRRYAALAIALLLFLAVTLVLWPRPKVQDLVQQPGPQRGTVVTRDPAPELDHLLAQLDALDAELRQTVRQAELLDARCAADVLLASANRW